MSPDDLKSKLRAMSPEDFCSHMILEARPALFRDDLEWVTWKSALALDLDVDPKSLVVVGSASTGASLNPKKDFRSFDFGSDIDVAVVSEWHFDVAWRFLSRVGAARYAWPRSAKSAYEDHKSRLVFHRTIATDKIVQYLPFAKEWVDGLARASTRDPASGRVVNARIYRDFQALRNYQLIGIKSARGRIEAE